MSLLKDAFVALPIYEVPFPLPSLSVSRLELAQSSPPWFESVESVSGLLRGKLQPCLVLPAASSACITGPGSQEW